MEIARLGSAPPDRTLLQVLREDQGCTAAKEGYCEGNCGACTVVIGEAAERQQQYKAINSCIRPTHSVDGMAVWTAEDISNQGAPAAGPPQGGASPLGGQRPATAAERGGQHPLHPSPQAMVNCHASQCGFCTPGFVMSLFAMHKNANGQTITREEAQAALSGNLCRCTGYRPILDAARAMVRLPVPSGCAVNKAATLTALKTHRAEPDQQTSYLRPSSLAALLQARESFPQAQVVAGCTDVGLWVTKQHRQFEQVLDVTAVAELLRVETHPHHIAIGAAVTLHHAYVALVAERPQLKSFAQRFAGLPVRNSGTLGGNVANGSPISDSMPLLIALGASVVLMRWKNTRAGGEIAHRELRLEDLYTGYRKNVMQPDELLAWIKVPRPKANETGHSLTPHTPASAAPPAPLCPGEGWGEGWGEGRPSTPPQQGDFLRVYKVSKRFDDDISAVCLALRITVQHGVVQQASIGAGGVAATPMRARHTEAALIGQAWNAHTVQAAQAALRASAPYRHTVLVNLLHRFWLESQGHSGINLKSVDIQALEIST